MMEKEGVEVKAVSADDLHLASWVLGARTAWSPCHSGLNLFWLILKAYRFLVVPASDPVPQTSDSQNFYFEQQTLVY